MKLWKAILLTILAACMQIAVFPKFELHVLAWVMLIPFLVALESRGVLASCLLGALFGLASALGVTYWLYIAVVHYFELDSRFGLAFVLVACLVYEGIYTALFGALWSLCGHLLKGWGGILIAPCFWVTCEILRASWLSENAWGIVGYSQYKVLPLIQIADITGVYGVSYVVVMANVALYRILRTLVVPGPVSPAPSGSRRQLILSTAVPCLVAAAVLIYGALRIHEFASPSGTDRHVTVAAIQGNIERGFRWNPIYYEKSLGRYLKMSRSPEALQADLVVWPENALNFYPDLESRFLFSIQSVMATPPRTLVTGAPHLKKTEDGGKTYFNSTYLIDGGGIQGIYNKNHLTPFSERKPSWLRGLFKSPGQAPAAFTPGTEATVFRLRGATFSTPVCFEMVYPELVRRFVNNGAQFLVNVSNDTWFGDTAGPYQHLVYSIFRAVENRRSVVRCANTGVSMFVSRTGRIEQRSGLRVDAVLSGRVIPDDSITFYTRHGDVFAALCALVTLCSLIAGLWSRNRAFKEA